MQNEEDKEDKSVLLYHSALVVEKKQLISHNIVYKIHLK